MVIWLIYALMPVLPRKGAARTVPKEPMQMLYDSESFVVVHMLADTVELVTDAAPDADLPPPAPRLARHGFEIVDKRSGKELYLDGSWAEMFQQKILAWQRQTPTQEEVEDTLDSYTGLAQNPVVVH